jgi:hypothetical protein
MSSQCLRGCGEPIVLENHDIRHHIAVIDAHESLPERRADAASLYPYAAQLLRIYRNKLELIA